MKRNRHSWIVAIATSLDHNIKATALSFHCAVTMIFVKTFFSKVSSLFQLDYDSLFIIFTALSTVHHQRCLYNRIIQCIDDNLIRNSHCECESNYKYQDKNLFKKNLCNKNILIINVKVNYQTSQLRFYTRILTPSNHPNT